MNPSADAADQVVKITLEGADYAIRLAGSGAKNIAVLLYTIAKEQNKTRGAERLNNMLRSGKPLKVYTFSAKDKEKFKEVAKEYGILYTILKDKDNTGDVFDVLVRAEDESKINRIVERFNLTKIDTASLKAELLKEKAERERRGESGKVSHVEPEQSSETVVKEEGPPPPIPEQTEEEYEEGVAELLLSDKPIQKEEQSNTNPTVARAEVPALEPVPSSSEKKEEKKTENDSLSEPTSIESSKENESVFPINNTDRESVREKVARIKREKEAASRNAPAIEPITVPHTKPKEK